MKEMNEGKPNCVGFIMDGNRRWARERGLPTLEGHRKGYAKVKEAMVWAKNAGIRCAILYAFSTENWGRPGVEVAYVLDLLRTVLKNEIDELTKDGVRLRFIGEIERFPKDIATMMREAEERTKTRDDFTLVIAASYGGRAEIVRAANAAVKEGKEVTEQSFSELLWTDGIPDPDLIIRTSGEERLSNFLPWQSVYSEFFFSKTYWPDFGETEFKGILEAYGKRQRRNGT